MSLLVNIYKKMEHESNESPDNSVQPDPSMEYCDCVWWHSNFRFKLEVNQDSVIYTVNGSVRHVVIKKTVILTR